MAVYALIDCNNFFVSCERVFDPSLENKPVLILSSNDGCAIARSNEAKSLGVEMGAPYFTIKDLCKKHDMAILSSNHYLYSDMSKRVMAAIAELAPNIDVYSIDEAFVRLDKLNPSDVMPFVRNIKAKIRQWTGISVSIGVAQTKTLAKLASKCAKSDSGGVYDLRNEEKKTLILDHTDLIHIWGIGKNLYTKLQAAGYKNAGELCRANREMLRKKFGLGVERVSLELNGMDCHDEEVSQTKQNIISSRTFGRVITELPELEEAISHYAVKACEKMREQKTKAQGVYVLLRTKFNPHNKENYSISESYWFEVPTDNTMYIVKIAKECLSKIYIDGEKYQKAGVVLLNLTNDQQLQTSFFDKSTSPKKEAIISVMSDVNRIMGSDTVFLAAQGIKREWSTKSGYRSPRYTTNWAELPVVR